MTENSCEYPGDREQAIVAYLYGDSGDTDAALVGDFKEHLSTCGLCRSELAAFEDVRMSLGRWTAPEPDSLRSDANPWGPPSGGPLRLQPDSTGGPIRLKPDPTRSVWRNPPAWAQAVAAVLLLGVAAGLANLDIRYDGEGLRVRTGWLDAAPVADNRSPDEGPWRAELTALEQRLRADLSPAPASQIAVSAASTEGPLGPDALRRLRALVEDSERRQQRELALRLGEAMRELSVQRQEDLVRIDRNIGAMQSNTGREMLRQRSDLLNYVTVRTAARPQ